MYTRIEVAGLLGISIRTLGKKILAGELKAINLNAGKGVRPMYRIPESAYQSYLKKCASPKN